MSNNNNNTPVEIELPLFSGFYESIFCMYDRYVEYETEYLRSEGKTDKEIAEYIDSMDALAGDRAVAEVLPDAFMSLWNVEIASEHPQLTIKSITYSDMTSPKFYNFETDRIYAMVEMDLQALGDWLKENPDEWGAMLSTRHRTRSGFISFYDHNPESWDLNDIKYWDHNELATAFLTILDYYDLDQMSLYNEADNLDEVYSRAVQA